MELETAPIPCPQNGKPHILAAIHGSLYCLNCKTKIYPCCEGSDE